MKSGERRRLKRLRTKYQNTRGREADYKNQIIRLRQQVAGLADGYVVETCPFCDTQDVFLWDIKEQGYMFFCPCCGERLMLCDYCEQDCDYDYGADRCSMM